MSSEATLEAGTAVRKSGKKLGDSLVKNLSKDSSKITSNESIAEQNKSSEEPFAEANLSEFPTAKEKKPQPIPIKNLNAKSTGSKPKSITGLVGIVLSLIAFGGVYYSATSLETYKTKVNEQVEDTLAQTGTLNSRVDELSASLTKANRELKEQQQQIIELQSYKLKFEAVNLNIEEMREYFTLLGSDIEKQTMAIGKVNEEISRIKESLKKIPVKTVTKTITKVKQTSKVYTLEDATLVSIDIWGAAVNAVLRANGSWIPLSVGEMYQGWRFVESSNNQAHFVKGKKTIKLSIKE